MARTARARDPHAGSLLHVRRPAPPPPLRWQRPTVGEFVERLQHEFGSGLDLLALQALGLGRGDTLAPSDIRALCAEIGVPPEDFGV